MRLVPASDSSLLVVFGESSGAAFRTHVLKLFTAIRRLEDPRIRNLHPAYASLLIDFDPLNMTFRELGAAVISANEGSSHQEWVGKTVEIPVCYAVEMGPDLEFVARHCKLSTEEVVKRHSATEYEVSFLGFSPGFAYLSGLATELNVPRQATPRKLVHAGSVAIAGTQTGVYPLDGPGGWQIIGRTPLRMFDWRRSDPTRLVGGDKVRFVSIERDDFVRLMECEAGDSGK